MLTTAIVILLATPAARVVISVAEYVRERDWLFVALTLIVLLTLAGSVVVAFWSRRLRRAYERNREKTSRTPGE